VLVRSANGTENAFVQCQAGERATGGGGYARIGDDPAAIHLSVPTNEFGDFTLPGEVPRGWAVFGVAGTTSTGVWVICSSP
jgi:hypothetical protein